jgi:hypothetical protein
MINRFGLLVAGGIGAAGIGYLMFKGGDKKEGADPASKDPSSAALPGDPAAAAGANPLGTTATGTTMAPQSSAGAFPTAGSAAPGTAGASTGGMLAGGEQVGPYTIMRDPESGIDLVFETATQQPVGVLDMQGNITPITVDANGNVSLSQDPTTSAALGQQGSLGQTGSLTPQVSSGPVTGTSSSMPQATSGGQYAQAAASLFANASNPAIGSASSDAMSGRSALTTPQAGSQAGAVSASGSSGQYTTSQVGNFTLIDDGSGTTIVLDTASQQPVGMMDAAGNITPISVDANGQVTVTGPTTGAGSAAGAATGGFSTGGSASGGYSTGMASPSTITSPTTITSPVGGASPYAFQG